MSNEYSHLKKMRNESWTKVIDQKMTIDDFIHGSFNFLRQYRYKPIVKAHSKEAVLFNYFYWMIQIERKVFMERELIKINLGSEDLLNKVLFMYVKRRDQMVRRLIWELNIKVKESYLVFNDTVEIILEDGNIIYSSQENLEKINVSVSDISPSKNPYYVHLLKI